MTHTTGGPSGLEQIDAAAAFIRERIGEVPEVAVILGSGLGTFATTLTDAVPVPYADIPDWPVSSVVGPCGGARLRTCRQPSGARVVRTRPLLRRARARDRDVRHARARAPRRAHADRDERRRRHQHAVRGRRADGDGRSHQPDGDQSAVGPNDERLGPRFPDMSAVYSSRLRMLVDEAARASSGIEHGIYLAVTGPSYETPAEIRAFARWAPTPSACRPCPRRSWRVTWGWKCSASRAFPTWPPACSARRCRQTK